jgi:hypothetical protein
MMVKDWLTQGEHIRHNSIIFLHSKLTVVVFGQINNLQHSLDQKTRTLQILQRAYITRWQLLFI